MSKSKYLKDKTEIVGHLSYLTHCFPQMLSL